MIAITGASGFVGSHVLYKLVSQGQTVKVIVRDIEKAQSKIHTTFSYYGETLSLYAGAIEWIEADIMNPVELLSAFEGVTKLYHCAGYVSFNPALKRELWMVNVLGSRNVVNAALSQNIEKLCFLSSIAALGSTNSSDAIDEETHWKPDDKHSLYSKAKYEAEQEAWRGIAEGLPTVILNAGVILGPGTWGESSTALFTAVDKGMKYYTKGTSGYVDVRDVAEMMIKAMNHNTVNQQFILTAENRSIEDLFSKIADGLGKGRPTKQASYTLLRFVAIWESLRYLVSRQSPRVTASSARTAVTQSNYSNQKLINHFAYSFISFDESIAFACNCFRKSNQ